MNIHPQLTLFTFQFKKLLWPQTTLFALFYSLPAYLQEHFHPHFFSFLVGGFNAYINIKDSNSVVIIYEVENRANATLRSGASALRSKATAKDASCEARDVKQAFILTLLTPAFLITGCKYQKEADAMGKDRKSFVVSANPQEWRVIFL